MTQKFIPILFSTEMVNAILEGRKTQTRRTKGLLKLTNHYFQSLVHHATDRYTFVEKGNYSPSSEDVIEVKAPYEVDDILWVRETYSNGSIENGKHTGFRYKADDISYPVKWKPSIFMPKEACRIFLKVSSVRVERLNDISESDAIAEGVEKIADYGTTGYKLYTEPEASYSDIDAVYSFESLWESIYGKESLDANPFVWVIEFEKIDKPQNFI